MARRRRNSTGKLFGPGIAISTVPPKDGEPQPNPRWVHIANEDVFAGHPQGPTAVTRSMLDEIVKNFKADPRYLAGVDGVGTAKVVPYDVAHVSEMDPRVGSPLANESAPAWVMDVAIRTGAEGAAQLWAFTRLGDQIKTAIEKGEITFVSIAYDPSAIDLHTGKPVGAVMTSVAFTNKPVMRELTPLAASMGFYDAAESDEDCLGCFKRLLGLPVATSAAEVLRQFAIVVGWATAGNMPIGVDGDEIIEAAKTILGAPVVTTPEQVLAQATTIFQRVTQENGGTAANNGAMAMPELMKRLAKLFGINPALEGAEDQVVTMATSHVEMAGKLKDILTAAGFANVAELVKSVPELVKARERLSSMQTELDTALKALSGFQDIEREAEIQAVMSVHAMPEKAKPALLFSLKADAVQFRKDYPLPDDKRAHLLTTFAAGRGGRQVETPKAGSSLPISERTRDGTEIDLRSFSGRNDVERVIAYLKSKDANFEKRAWGEQIKAAGMFRNENQARLIFA